MWLNLEYLAKQSTGYLECSLNCLQLNCVQEYFTLADWSAMLGDLDVAKLLTG